MEFLEANAKAIPIYVFVKSDVLTLLPIWKTNPQANFSSAVDSPKLFEFIDLLRAKKNLWVFPFKNAQEICSTLRRQLSYLLSDCLDFRSRLYPPDPVLGLLGPDSLRTYLEKPSYWEYLALAHCLRENIERHQSKRLDVELGISFGATIHLDDRQATVNWISKKISELGVVVDNFDRAFNTGVIPAVGPPGVPGDMTRIAHLAARFGEAYLSLLEWTLEFRTSTLIKIEPPLLTKTEPPAPSLFF